MARVFAGYNRISTLVSIILFNPIPEMPTKVYWSHPWVSLIHTSRGCQIPFRYQVQIFWITFPGIFKDTSTPKHICNMLIICVGPLFHRTLTEQRSVLAHGFKGIRLQLAVPQFLWWIRDHDKRDTFWQSCSRQLIQEAKRETGRGQEQDNLQDTSPLTCSFQQAQSSHHSWKWCQLGTKSLMHKSVGEHLYSISNTKKNVNRKFAFWRKIRDIILSVLSG